MYARARQTMFHGSMYSQVYFFNLNFGKLKGTFKFSVIHR